MEPKWLEWAKEIQAISQTGLAYCNDVFDKERYERLRDISKEIMATYTDVPLEKLTTLFANETGYQTPKVDIRAVIIEGEQILLGQEKSDGKWALPGGWADIGHSPGEVAVKEVEEETGLQIIAKQILAIYDTQKHDHPYFPYHVYKIFIKGEQIGGALTSSIETYKAAFFPIDSLPPLSTVRNTEKQIRQAFFDVIHENPTCRFD